MSAFSSAVYNLHTISLRVFFLRHPVGFFMENTMFLMIFPFSAVPAPEKSITPTREPLADVFWYAPWHAPLEEPLLQEELPYSA